MKVSLILKGPADHFGRIAVYIRTSEKQKRTFKKTSLLLTTDQFTRFKKGAPLKAEVQQYKKFLSLMDEQDEPETNSTNFFKYVHDCMRSWDKEKTYDTLRQMQSELNKLQTFKTDFSLQEITPAFLQKYKEHCYSLGNKQNTLWKTFKFIKMIIRKAHREGLINDNPFNVFEMPKYKDPPRKYLMPEDMDRIMKNVVDREGLQEQLIFCATWFLISCYTGLRYGDIHGFNKKRDIVGGRIIIYTSKTGEVVSMPLSERVKSLLKSIDYKPMHYTNEAYNRLLKVVGDLAEIKTPLTSHLARHTAAIRWANAGISQEVTGKLLGHVSIRTTGIYYKISGQRIDNEMKGIDD